MALPLPCSAVDDSIYMLPEFDLPPVLHGLPSNSSVLEQELKKLIEGVVFEAGERGWSRVGCWLTCMGYTVGVAGFYAMTHAVQHNAVAVRASLGSTLAEVMWCCCTALAV